MMSENNIVLTESANNIICHMFTCLDHTGDLSHNVHIKFWCMFSQQRASLYRIIPCSCIHVVIQVFS